MLQFLSIQRDGFEKSQLKLLIPFHLSRFPATVMLFASQLSLKNKDFSGESFWGCCSERFALRTHLQLALEQKTDQKEAFGPKNYSLKQSFNKNPLLRASSSITHVHSIAQRPFGPRLSTGRFCAHKAFVSKDMSENNTRRSQILFDALQR